MMINKQKREKNTKKWDLFKTFSTKKVGNLVNMNKRKD